MIYADAIERIGKRLPANFTDAGRKKIGTLLVLAANWGAGDAFAGNLLKDVGKEFLEKAAETLQLEGFKTMLAGPSGALNLLGCRSKDATIDEIMKELDTASLTGKGV